MKSRRTYLICAGTILLASTFSGQGFAQPAAPILSRVTLTHVKPDMLNEWLDLQKNEVVPALKKAGEKSRTVYVTSLFGNAYEYVLITPFEKYAQFDGDSPLIKALGAPAAARLNDKLRKCVVSSSSYSITRLPELSNVVETTGPQLLVTARYRIANGKIEDFQNLLKSDILPVYKKAKVGLIVNRRGPGSNTSDFTMSTVYSKYADLDGGPFLAKQLGLDGAAKLNAKFAGLRTLVEVLVRRQLPDLSF